MSPLIRDPRALSAVIRPKIAIGSGGLRGKGWFTAPSVAAGVLLERHTDFIFAVPAGRARSGVGYPDSARALYFATMRGCDCRQSANCYFWSRDGCGINVNIIRLRLLRKYWYGERYSLPVVVEHLYPGQLRARNHRFLPGSIVMSIRQLTEKMLSKSIRGAQKAVACNSRRGRDSTTAACAQ